MIRKEPASIKKIGLWFLIGMFGIVGICLIFISIVSIWTGFANMQQNGFWVPISGGILLFIFVLFIFICTTRRILFQMKEQDILAK